MGQWEYKVVPTPRKPKRAKGVKGNSDRFAFALTEAINDVASEGWEFVKTETLPMEAKPGLFKARVEVFQSLMVFRRPLGGSEALGAEDAGAILPVAAAATTTALTAERYVAPTPENQSSLSASEAEMPEPVAAIENETAQQVEAAQAPADKVEEDELAFDVGGIDPLKRVVEANRTGG